jgi:hypothetical protein
VTRGHTPWKRSIGTTMNYTVIAQNRDEMLDAANSPSLTIWPYLLQSEQTRLLNSLSVYTDKGTSREQARLFYMNATAVKLWQEMKRPATVIGTQHRPPKTAVLAFGMPFSE